MGANELSNRLIIALDVDTAQQARAIINNIGDCGNFYKVGLQLFTAEGPSFVRDLVAARKKVFLDLKLHEIPISVAKAVHAANALGVSMVTVHASAGLAALVAAAAAASANPNMQIIAVTVITSLKDKDLEEIGIHNSASEQVLRLARLAVQAGCDGVVASAQEAAALRQALGEKISIVTPGVRLLGDKANDQSRITTPAQAIRAGASHLVIGRPITEAVEPRAVVEKVWLEMTTARSVNGY